MNTRLVVSRRPVVFRNLGTIRPGDTICRYIGGNVTIVDTRAYFSGTGGNVGADLYGHLKLTSIGPISNAFVIATGLSTPVDTSSFTHFIDSALSIRKLECASSRELVGAITLNNNTYRRCLPRTVRYTSYFIANSVGCRSFLTTTRRGFYIVDTNRFRARSRSFRVLLSRLGGGFPSIRFI